MLNLALCLVMQSGFAASDASPWFYAQAGAGRLGEDPAGVVALGAGYSNHTFDLAVDIPLWVRLYDLPPNEEIGENQSPFFQDYRQPKTWASFLRQLSWHSLDGQALLRAGALSQETLGRGLLVDHYSSGADALSRSTGARARLETESFVLDSLMGSIVAPELVALNLDSFPFRALGGSLGRDIRLSASGAADFSAPSEAGESLVSVGAVELGASLFRDQILGIEIFGAAVAESFGAKGAHGGLRLEVGSGKGHTPLLQAQVEYIAGSEDFVPAYFDVAYDSERRGLGYRSWDKKADGATGRAESIRASFDLRHKRLSMGAGGLFDSQKTDGDLFLYTRYSTSRLSLAAQLWGRSLGDKDSHLSYLARTQLSLDASWTIIDRFYGFSRLYSGAREESDGSRHHVYDWLAGVGYSY